jgi:hypothetical protein
VGCGSSSKDPTSTRIAAASTTPPAETKAAYIVAGDALCKVYDEEDERLGVKEKAIVDRHLGNAREAEELQPFYEKAASSDRAYTTKFGAIPKPPSEVATLERMMLTRQNIASLVEREATALKNPEPTQWSVLRKEEKELDEHVYSQETAYGFKICGHTVNFHKGGGSTTTSSSEPKQYHIGQSAAVGNLTITPTSFDRLPTNGESVKWRLTVSVKNDGSEGAEPFCGSGQAALTDKLGRVYEGDSVVNEANSPNCGEKIQPGLTTTGYLVDFKTPANVQPASLSIWGEDSYKEQAQTWTVG